MADPVTNNYSFVLPTVGGDTNVWGGFLNNGVITAADNALGGVQAVAITSADVTLTAAQFQNAMFVVTGALTANRNLIIPLSPNSLTVACAGRFIVVNNTTAAFNLTVKTVAGGSVGVTVGQGQTAFLYSDGTNVGYASNGVGAVFQSVNGNPNGQLAGIAGSINTNASVAFDYMTGNIWVCTTTGNAVSAVWAPPTISIRRGFDTAVNLQLIASNPGNNLTVTLAAGDTGLAPTSADPITVIFPSATPGNGAPLQVNVTSALSIATATGASLGSLANKPFRLWYVLFYNGGTPVLGVINCSTPNGVFPLNESREASSTILNGASTNPGVFYTPGGVVTNSVFRILGFIEYENTTLVTPGTYTSVPDWVRLFGPGVRKPGDVIQNLFFTTSSATTGINTGFAATTITLNITPSSKANLVKVSLSAQVECAIQAAANNVIGQVRRSATQIGQVQIVGTSANGSGGSLGLNGIFSWVILDAPGVNTSTTYQLYATATTGSNTVGIGQITLEEIMG